MSLLIVDAAEALDGVKPIHGLDGDSFSGALISVNPDNITFDVAPFSYYVSGVKYFYAGVTGQPTGFTSAGDFIIIGIDSTGLNIKTKNSFFTPSDLDSILEIGGLVTLDGSTILGVVGDSSFKYNDLQENLYKWAKFGKQTDFIGTAGSIAEGTTPLRLSIASGDIIDPNLNRELITAQALIDSVLVYKHVAGTWVFEASANPFFVDNLQYDDGTDLATLGNNKWASHTVARSSRSQTIYFIYSQGQYDNEADAIDAEVSLGGFGTEVGNEVEPLAKIVVQKSSANINTVIDVRNQSSNIVSASTSTLQTTYDRSAPDPEIETTVTNGALTVKVGTGLDSDKVYEGKNVAGAVTFSVSGAGDIEANDITVAGDLTVNGTTTTINSTTVLVEDKNIELGVVDIPTDLTADGGGITLKGASDKTILWSNSTNSWDFNQSVNVTGNLQTSGNVGVKTTSINYGSLVVNSTADTGKTLIGDSFQAVPTTEDVGAVYTNADGLNLEAYNSGYKDIWLGKSGGNIHIGENSGALTSRLGVYGAGGDYASGNILTYIKDQSNSLHGLQIGATTGYAWLEGYKEVGFGRANVDLVLNSEGGNVLVGTYTQLTRATTDHKLQVDGYLLHKLGWRDLVSPFTNTSSGGSAPTLVNLSNGARLYRFGAGDSVHTSYHVDHDYAEGTDAYHHVHWLPETAMNAGDTVTWRISYVVARGHNQGESLLATRTSFDVVYTSPAGGTVAGDHIVSEASLAQAYDLKEPDTVILAEIEMVSKTFGGNVIGIQADLHYQTDREATIGKRPDFNVAD